MARAVKGATAGLRDLRDRRRLLRSGLFDSEWYCAALDGRRPLDPALHYLKRGALEGLDPHPLFNSRWYRKEYPDVDHEGVNPLLHYLLTGAMEGRDPNPYFSSSYYLAAYPDVAREKANPLLHYTRYGAKEGRRPSLRFDPTYYRRQITGDVPDDEALLNHFLAVGLEQGLSPAADLMNQDGEPVEWAQILSLRPWAKGQRGQVALFATHSANGSIKPHAVHHLKALMAHGVRVILIVAADQAFTADSSLQALAGLYVRENVGYDFAAWSHVLKLTPDLWDADGLYLLNDSVMGPVNPQAYSDLLRRIESGPSDVTALTESREQAWHLQSYFLHLKPAALRSARLQTFFYAVRNLSDKQAVIDRYEVAFAGAALDAGLTLETLFRQGSALNPTLFAWRELLSEGFPFLKVSVATGRHDAVDAEGWRDALGAAGFDVAVADVLLETPPRVFQGSRFSDTPAASRGKLERIAFHGPWNYSNGLGSASRGYLSALWRLGSPLNLHSLKAPFHIHRRISPGMDVRDFFEPADVAIVHLNPDGWHLLSSDQKREIDRARVRIGLWVWEMDHIPDFFLPNFDAVDAIWAPSRYCAEVFKGATARPVQVVPHVVPVPAEAHPSFNQTILYAFDGSSYLARKNPTALVAAFGASRLAERGWRLILKTKNLADNPAHAADLVARCQENAGVELIDKPVTRRALKALFDRTDIYASPHCSEGFGLTIAEAMAAGKTVVATDYGGSTDFLDATCGYPVPYALSTLSEDFGHYQKGGRWAQIDEGALCDALQDAAGRLERGDKSLGRAARRRIEDTLSPAVVCATMRKCLDRLSAEDPAAPVTAP